MSGLPGDRAVVLDEIDDVGPSGPLYQPLLQAHEDEINRRRLLLSLGLRNPAQVERVMLAVIAEMIR